MHKHAFTLVELLVVIATIVVLMGILIPSIGYMQTRAAVAKTTAKINQISGAISVFHSSTGRYPLQDPGDFPSDTAYNAIKGDGGWKPNDKNSIVLWSAALAKKLALQDPGSFGANGTLVATDTISDNPITDPVILDAWDNPIRYVPWTQYLSVEKALNPDSYQIWSAGPDGISQTTNSSNVATPADSKDGDLAYFNRFGDDITPWSE